MWVGPSEEARSAIISAIAREDLLKAVQTIYANVEQELARIQPRCEMSGRCCRFEEYGHRLFVTTAELAAFVAAARQAPQLSVYLGRPDGGGCRFQEMRLCRAHLIRPLGCRLFFCDESHEQELQSLYERMHAQLRELHDRLGVPYFCIEWRQGLEMIAPMI
jgi:Fe-S-cluster containining protein